MNKYIRVCKNCGASWWMKYEGITCFKKKRLTPTKLFIIFQQHEGYKGCSWCSKLFNKWLRIRNNMLMMVSYIHPTDGVASKKFGETKLIFTLQSCNVPLHLAIDNIFGNMSTTYIILHALLVCYTLLS